MKTSLNTAPTHATYREHPYHLRGPFAEFNKKTNRPEYFDGLYTGPVDRNEEFRIVEQCVVDKTKRQDGRKVYCTMCRCEKFYSGYLVWLPRFGVIVLIGHCCSDKNNMRHAQELTKNTLRQSQLEDFIVGALPKVEASIEVLKTLTAAAEQAQRVHHKLRIGGRYFFESLRIPRRTGQLRLETVLTETRALAYEPTLARGGTASVYFGEFSGSKLFQGHFDPLTHLNRIIIDCQTFPRSANQLDAIDTLGRMGNRERLDVQHRIRHACREYKKLYRDLTDFYRFFESEHIGRLSQWANHPDNPMPFTCEFREHTTTVGIDMHGGPDRVSFSVRLNSESFPSALPFEDT